MRRWLILTLAASALVAFGPRMIEALGMNDYRDILVAFAIALFLQPWIIYQLRN